MGFIAGKAIRAKGKQLAEKLNELFIQYGSDSEIELVPQVGPIYVFNIKKDGKITNRAVAELQLQFNPLDVDMVSTKKLLRKEVKITSVEKHGVSYLFKCS